MDFSSIIDLTKAETETTILEFLKDNLTDEQQLLFAKSFYMTLFDGDKYPIHSNDVVKWLGYSRKDPFKRLLDKHLKEGDHYEVFHRPVENPTSGGRPSENFKLTVDAFKILGMKAGTKQGDNIRMYYIELEKLLFKYAMLQSAKKLQEKDNIIQEKLIENQQLLQENEMLKCNDIRQFVYIYDTDTRVGNVKRTLKIGVTENIRKRAKPYKQITPYGMMVFSTEIPANTNLRIAETWLHNLLKPYQTSGEVFEMDIEEAKMWIVRLVNTVKLSQIQDLQMKTKLLTKLVDTENEILGNNVGKISTADFGCQTDFNTELCITNQNQTETENDFERYISECCEHGSEFEVPSTDIIGQYRIWSKKVDKETYHQLLDYLNVKYRPLRLNTIDKEGVVYGFRGVRLKLIEYQKSFAPNDPETFIYHMCKFTPSGKILQSNLLSEFEKWGKRINKTIEIKELKAYMKTCPYVLAANVWTQDGHGQGYYGLCLKTDEIYHRKPPTTSKRVEKRSANDDVIDSWSTIAKAAQAEGMSAAKMSRLLKDSTQSKVPKDGHYYIVANV